jgi:hypothetical protein
LPDFVAVGPARTGTTWLHGVLYHRACLPEDHKETHFFDRFHYKGLDWYLDYFRQCVDGRLVGEIIPAYFALPVVRDWIACTLAQCSIICTLREPVARAPTPTIASCRPWARLAAASLKMSGTMLRGDRRGRRLARRHAPRAGLLTWSPSATTTSR